MKISGVKIVDLNDHWLAKYHTIFWILSVMCGVFAAFFAFFVIGFPILSAEYWEPYFLITVIMSLGGMIGFICGSVYSIKRLIALRKELEKRNVDAAERTVANNSVKKAVLWIVIGIAVFALILYFSLNDGLPKCVNCGRNAMYTESGYCYDCYQDVFNYIKEIS